LSHAFPTEIETKLEGYPTPVIESYKDFYDSKNPESLERFVLGVLIFLEDDDDSKAAETLDGSASLVEDLGISSITIAELVFLIEEIFEVEIENNEIIEISTVSELKDFITRKIA